MRFLLRWIIRLAGPCPFWHRTTHRLRQTADQRVWYTCDLCARVTSEALKGHKKGEKIAPATAVKVNWFDGIRKRA